jgi:hypothetical protein
MSDQRVIQILGRIDGEPSPWDGQYVVEYDPDPNPAPAMGPGWYLTCHLVTTPELDKAARFSTQVAMETWRRQSRTAPLRPDGKPNRPLAAFTVVIFDADKEDR